MYKRIGKFDCGFKKLSVMNKNEYIPGVCNIGPAEMRKRRRSGIVGLTLTIILLVVLTLIHASDVWMLIVFIPATIAASGFLQSAFHFCAGFGMRGLINFGSEVGKTDTIEQAEFRKKDKKKAFLILSLSLTIGIVTAIAAFFIHP
jgi:hypothetical protein